MANTTTRVWDARIIELTGSEKVPLGNGGAVPVATTVNKLKEFIGGGQQQTYDKGIIVHRSIPLRAEIGDTYFFAKNIELRFDIMQEFGLSEQSMIALINSSDWRAKGHTETETPIIRTFDSPDDPTIKNFRLEFDNAKIVKIKQSLLAYRVGKKFEDFFEIRSGNALNALTASPNFEIRGGKVVCVKPCVVGEADGNYINGLPQGYRARQRKQKFDKSRSDGERYYARKWRCVGRKGNDSSGSRSLKLGEARLYPLAKGGRYRSIYYGTYYLMKG